MNKQTHFTELKEIFRQLHGPRGCLWDKEQTHRSILSHLQEEVGEFIEAVERGNHAHMREELGDILLHVMFHAQIASKHKRFDIEDVIDELMSKLKRRHPHVFGSKKVSSTRQIMAHWEQIKKMEKRGLYAGPKKNKGR